jgi:hypothetical protein
VTTLFGSAFTENCNKCDVVQVGKADNLHSLETKYNSLSINIGIIFATEHRIYCNTADVLG